MRSALPARSDRVVASWFDLDVVRRVGVDQLNRLAVEQLVDLHLVGTVAVFRSQKRLDLWLDVAERVATQISSARFVVVGDGPLRDDIEARARNSPIASRILLTGLRRDVRSIFAAMDVFLTTSQFEGLPLALLEAMAAELAVVASAVGGIPEAIENGISGVLVDFRDLSGAAGEVVALLQDPGRRCSLGAAARTKVAAEFSISRMAMELEGLYRQLARPR